MSGPVDFMGADVVVTDILPIVPTDGENARRMVRHGMAEVLTWIGEAVGPEPGALTHAIATGKTLFVSPELASRFKEDS